MPPVQKTFTIIPKGPSLASGPGAGQPAFRPMTSKQVRKAYKAANQGPSMSRAERIKWERAEQERIRKEFEKEKAAVKAKAARERKKEKELAEREQRRRDGLPLVTVRPSQDTIARFVRGNGTGKKRDSAGLGLDEKSARQLLVIEEVVSREHERLPDQGQEGSNMMDPLLASGLERSPASKEGSAKPGTNFFCIEIGEEDYEGLDGDEIETFSIVEERPQGLNPVTSGSPIADDTSFLNAEPFTVIRETNPQGTTRSNPPEKEMFPEVDLLAEWDDSELDMLAIEAMTQQTASLASTHNEGRYCMPAPKSSSIEKDLGIEKAFLVLDACQLDPPPAKPPDQEERSMGPPPLPVPQPSRRLAAPLDQHPQLPPLSTQAIFSNVDDFFPTASQLELELEEDFQPLSRRSTPLPDLGHSPLANDQPPCHVSKLDSSKFTKGICESCHDEEMLAAISLRCHGAACFQTWHDRASVEKAGTTSSKAPMVNKPPEPNSHLQLKSSAFHPKQRLHLAEKKLAAIRQADMPPKPPLKTQKTASKRPLKPMIRHPPPKDLGKPHPVAPPSISQKRAPPTEVPPTDHSTFEKMVPPTTAAPPPTNKENILPPAGQEETKSGLPAASQESYGGDWVDEAALELMV